MVLWRPPGWYSGISWPFPIHFPDLIRTMTPGVVPSDEHITWKWSSPPVCKGFHALPKAHVHPFSTFPRSVYMRCLDWISMGQPGAPHHKLVEQAEIPGALIRPSFCVRSSDVRFAYPTAKCETIRAASCCRCPPVVPYRGIGPWQWMLRRMEGAGRI